jgi:competence protein ComEA
VAARLDSASLRLEADEARRGRPLEVGEMIDANRAPAPELDRLPGVGPSLARAWIEHRELHGPLRRASDLEAIPGIGPATARRLSGLLQFSSGGPMLEPREDRGRGDRGGTPRDASALVDLNRADSMTLVGLPGIGPSLAGRVLARRRRGRFSTIDELLEVRGIGPSTLDRLRSKVRVRRGP